LTINVQTKIVTAETLRTQRRGFLFGGEIPPNRTAFLSQEKGDLMCPFVSKKKESEEKQ